MAVSLITLAPMPVAVGQSSVAVSPFVSYVPSATKNPFAGLALTFGGTTGLAFRGSADISIANPDTTSGGYRPWSADADAILFLGGLGGGATVFSRALSPYLFSGIGLSGGDSAGVNVVNDGWSYGAGAAIPLGLDADLFAEVRWRMPAYVMPTARDAPDSKSELRFGLSFLVGGGGGSSEPRPSPRRKPRRHHAERDDDESASSASASASSASSSASAVINVNLPGAVVVSSTPSRRSRHFAITTAERYLGARYYYGGALPRNGFDCSGFTQYVYSRHGVHLPRTAREQARVGRSLGRDWAVLEPGDLMLFSDDEYGEITHVAIYAGDNRIIHASETAGGVRYDDLSSDRGAWFRERFVMARRVTSP